MTRAEMRRGGEPAVVPDAQFRSYYGQPVLKPPVWKAHWIAGYFFFGGLSGASAVLGAGAGLSGRPALRKVARLGSAAALSAGMVGLVADLGRPARFVNMLRVAKPTSPMSMGSWLLAAYGPVCGAAAASEVLGVAPAVGNAAGLAAAALGPAVSTYTATLVSDTAVPAWHEAWPELPFVFAGSSAASAGGLGLLFAPVAENAPAARLAAGGGLMTLAAMERMKRRVGLVAEPYEHGRSGRLLKIAEVLTIAGSLAAAVGRRSAMAARAGGAALLVGAACERFGIFDAGMASARDPKYTVVPQRQRVQARSAHD